jgi:hypothetical protein
MIGTLMSDDAPFLHESSGTIRFWVAVDGKLLGASVSREALHHRYRPAAVDEDPLETFLANVADVEAAARRRYAQGSREPVMLREHDLRAPEAG